jgi:serine/threonine protein kinase
VSQPKQFETATETYIREDALGEGGAGFVFKVRDTSGTELALKVLKPGLRPKSKGKRFRNEIAFLRGVVHPHVVPVLDWGVVPAGDSDPVPFLLCPSMRQPFEGS